MCRVYCAAIRLPESMLVQLGAKVGDSIELDIQTNIASLRAEKPQYKLADLLAQMHGSVPIVSGWDDMPPVGKEIY